CSFTHDQSPFNSLHNRAITVIEKPNAHGYAANPHARETSLPGAQARGGRSGGASERVGRSRASASKCEGTWSGIRVASATSATGGMLGDGRCDGTDGASHDD